MPITVPTLGPNDETAPEVPQGGGLDVQTNPSQMGGALAQGIGSAGGDLEKVALQQKQLQDDTTIQAVTTKLGQSSMTKLYDPKTGVLSQHGPAAAAADKAITDFKTERDTAIAGLQDNAQREAVMKIATGQQFEMEHWAGRHVAQESAMYQQQTYSDANQLSVQKAALGASDPVAVNIARQEIAHNIDRQAGVMGWDKDQRDAETLRWSSQLHSGVIEQMLTDHQPQVAKQYLADHGAEMDANVRDHYTKAVNVGDLLGQAQSQSDAIVGGSKDLQDAIAKVQAIKDPELRQETQGQVEHAFALKDRALEQASRSNFNGVMTKLLNNGGDKQALNGSDVASLTWEQRATMENYVAAMNRHEAIQTDMPTYFDVRAGFANPATRAQYAAKDPMLWADKLSTADMKEVAGWRAEALAGSSAGPKNLPGLYSRDQIVARSLAQAGMDPRAFKEDPNGGAPTVNQDTVAFQKQIQAQVDAYQQETGKQMPDEVLQQRVDQLLIHTHTTQPVSASSWYRPWSWGSTVPGDVDLGPTFKLPHANEMAYSDDQVPDADRTRIQGQFEAGGLKPSSHQIADVYNAEVTGKRARMPAQFTDEQLQPWRTILSNPGDPAYKATLTSLHQGLKGFNQDGEFDPVYGIRARQVLAMMRGAK